MDKEHESLQKAVLIAKNYTHLAELMNLKDPKRRGAATVKFLLNKYDLAFVPTNSRRSSAKFEERYSKEQVMDAIINSSTIKSVLDKLNLPLEKQGYRNFHILVAYYGLQDIPFLPRVPKNQVSYMKLSDKDFFINGSYKTGANIKDRLLKKGWEYKCSNTYCDLQGKIIWNNKPITFQVDHISGNSLDNRIDNLRFLCPMCHSQTETYGGKNVHRYDKCECGNNKNNSLIKCTVCLPKHMQPTSTEVHTPALVELYVCPKCKNPKTKVSEFCIKCAEHPAKIVWASVEEITFKINEKGYFAYGKEIGVSDNAIRKHLRNNGVSVLPKRFSK